MPNPCSFMNLRIFVRLAYVMRYLADGRPLEVIDLQSISRSKIYLRHAGVDARRNNLHQILPQVI